MPTCLECGHKFKSSGRDTRLFVLGCSYCTRLFPDSEINKIVEEFRRFR